MMRRLVPALATAATLAGMFSGCSILEPQPDLTRFFVLASLAEPATDTSNLRIGIGPLALPDYLRRTEMARRDSETEVRYADTSRWAEPLEEGLARTLAENIALLVGTKRVLVVPAPIRSEPDVTVPIEVIRFEPTPDGDVLLIARWVVRWTGEEGESQVHVSRITAKPTGSSWKSRSRAMSRATLDLSREIADAIRATAATR